MSSLAPTILTARRAYLYPMDGIRLSVLCTTAVQEELKRAFAFQVSAVAAPPSIFGEVPPTAPPGLVFEVGELKGKKTVPIRALMFNSRQLIVDVAAPSAFIDRVKQKIDSILSRFQAPDGRPVLTASTGTADQSEMVIQANLPVSIGLSHRAWQAFTSIVPDDLTPVLGLLLRGTRGPSLNEVAMAYTLEPRANTDLGDHYWFSSAPVDTDEHLRFLTKLITALASPSGPVAKDRTSRLKRLKA